MLQFGVSVFEGVKMLLLRAAKPSFGVNASNAALALGCCPRAGAGSPGQLPAPFSSVTHWGLNMKPTGPCFKVYECFPIRLIDLSL